ncbi:hypothetical protein [Halocalculus aciditolerans]|uniref:Uncharacterized protein n=1 Tax=Halocalculus aciditolerans TaxID=1383812 RepID=A0A830FEE1_9EURY|nr:hypothetical protein [Halocalculus aciditolerans]GGL67126.1 hypothetical protein GCM10009039_26400 [Halocalculus aciditolerans]
MAIHYLISEESRERINNEFWNGYDPEHWFYKIKMYDALLENTADFMDEMGDEELQEKSADSFHQAIESEIVFNFYHMTESLFMLISVCNSLLPWVEMRHIRVNEIADFMRDVVVEKDWEDGHIKQIFYPGMREPEEHEGTMEPSIEFIEEYLARMSEWYLDNDIYNEYKHGMRLSTSGGRLQIAPEKEFMGETEPVVFEREGTTHVYLKEEEVGRDDSEVYYTLTRVMSGFDYELFQQFCYINYLLIDQIVSIRREQLQGSREDEEEARIEVHSFHDMDIDEIFDYNHEKEWEFTVSYPAGDSMVTIE